MCTVIVYYVLDCGNITPLQMCAYKAIIIIVHNNDCTIIIAGVTAQLFNTTTCIGDTITMNCTVDTDQQTWHFEPIGATEVLLSAGTSADVVRMGFTFRLLEFNLTHNIIVTSITGTVTDLTGLNNSMIVCRNGQVPRGQGEQQEAMVKIYGKKL